MTIHPTNAFISFRTIYLFPVKETFRTNYDAIYYSKFNFRKLKSKTTRAEENGKSNPNQALA